MRWGKRSAHLPSCVLIQTNSLGKTLQTIALVWTLLSMFLPGSMFLHCLNTLRTKPIWWTRASDWESDGGLSSVARRSEPLCSFLDKSNPTWQNWRKEFHKWCLCYPIYCHRLTFCIGLGAIELAFLLAIVTRPPSSSL
jgi:hypothetical protein